MTPRELLADDLVRWFSHANEAPVGFFPVDSSLRAEPERSAEFVREFFDELTVAGLVEVSPYAEPNDGPLDYAIVLTERGHEVLREAGLSFCYQASALLRCCEAP